MSSSKLITIESHSGETGVSEIDAGLHLRPLRRSIYLVLGFLVLAWGVPDLLWCLEFWFQEGLFSRGLQNLVFSVPRLGIGAYLLLVGVRGRRVLAPRSRLEAGGVFVLALSFFGLAASWGYFAFGLFILGLSSLLSVDILMTRRAFLAAADPRFYIED